jgi:uncharacterized protein
MQALALRRSENGAFMERWDDEQGSRWRFHWGPSDVFISADGPTPAIDKGLDRAWECFADLLPGLVARLSSLRSSAPTDWASSPEDPEHAAQRVATRMSKAVLPFAEQGLFITPMAAVAGSIAQELLDCFDLQEMKKVVVNNGGDIAFHLALEAQLRCGVHGLGGLKIDARHAGRGLATSGFGGRSCTLGIAESVTVLALTAAQADAAATMIANAVNVDNTAIVRCPASELRDDSDLGDRLVTVHVPQLPAQSVARALRAGLAFAKRCQQLGLIHAALLSCQGQTLDLDMKGMMQ